ncbi:putative lipoprotein [compost metagenome]
MTVKEYGSKYAVVASSITVSIDAELIDLRNGAKLWSGSKQVVQAGNNGGGLIGMLVQAMVDQVVNTLSDRSYGVAGMTNQMLLSAGQPGGILYGPRSPRYDTQ